MGLPVMIYGESGTGKTASLRNFPNSDVALVNVAAKVLPFRGKFTTLTSDSYREVKKFLKECGKKTIVIDDAQYLMANEFMRRATEKGYEKFTEIAQNFWDLVQTIRNLDDDTIVYFLMHSDRDQFGNERVKTIGKMLDEKITLEGMFTVVLKTVVQDGKYYFSTQNSGIDTVKSPIGLFESNLIANDLHLVDDALRDYYDFEVEEKPTYEEIKKEEPKKSLAEQLAEEQSAPSPKVKEVVEEVKEEVKTPVRKTRSVQTATATPVVEQQPTEPVVRRRRRVIEE